MTNVELKAWAEAHAPAGCSVAKAVLELMKDTEEPRKIIERQREVIAVLIDKRQEVPARAPERRIDDYANSPD